MIAVRVAFATLVALAILVAGGERSALAATFTVDATDDDPGVAKTACTGAADDCSLRGAMTNAAGSGGGDLITFDPVVFPSGAPATITLSAILPLFSGGGDTIDGSGAGVIIDATGEAPPSFTCISVPSAGNTIKGLQFTDCINGIALGNAASDGNTIGPGNVFFDNIRGIFIGNAGATGNSIVGNKIGTNAAGTAVPAEGGNVEVGILIWGADNTVGGENTADRNIISGNTGTGVAISGVDATGNVIQGNYIGTDATGTVDLGNSGNGVTMDEAQDNTVGGTEPGAGNLISGNNGHGVSIFDSTSTGNEVLGNLIGTDVTGTLDLGNSVYGVNIGFGQDNVIGGTTAAARNIISGNGGFGIEVSQSATGNEILGNFIGTDITGSVAIANGEDGVRMLGAPNNTIGGTEGTTLGGACTGACNLISGNAVNGVQFFVSSSTGNQVLGNFIGTDVTGTVGLGNGQDGVHINDAPDNIIGGTEAGAGNLISSNVQHGIRIRSEGATGNSVLGNLIGTDATGTVDLGNTSEGVQINSADNTVGGTTAAARNVISGNNSHGIEIGGAAASGNDVLGNYIGTDISGMAGIGNGMLGILISDAPATDIGGSASGAGNLISGNGLHGVGILFASATGTEVAGNRIGTDVLGIGGIPNSGNGVLIGSDAANNEVGSPLANDGNTIAFNTSDGVEVSGAATIGNAVRGNSIYYNDGLAINNVAGGNTELAPPVIAAAGSASGTACPSCNVDVYSDDADEGRVYHGSVTADGLGDWSLPGAVNGPNVTATATDAAGNTSEFSSAFACTDTDGDGLCDSADPCPSDTDCDGDLIPDAAEVNCGSDAANDGLRPERVDGPFAGVDDDGDTQIDEPLTPGSGLFDCDGDGWNGEDERHIFSAASTANDQDACGADGWPADILNDVLVPNGVSILDLTAYIDPVRYFGTDVADWVDQEAARRRDVSPGNDGLLTDINILDLTLLALGEPPMLNGNRNFNSTCPWPG